jgi:hypothetical protein
VADTSAAGGHALRHPNAGVPKLNSALASPEHYFEIQFEAQAGVPYRLWVRGRADSNSWANDSIYAQFSDSVTASGEPSFQIGTTSATTVTLEDCINCGLRGWGWQDNGYGTAPGSPGQLIHFSSPGVHTLRVQTREDGPTIDQIVLSPELYLSTAPGATKDDTTILTP